MLVYDDQTLASMSEAIIIIPSEDKAHPDAMGENDVGVWVYKNEEEDPSHNERTHIFSVSECRNNSLGTVRRWALDIGRWTESRHHQSPFTCHLIFPITNHSTQPLTHVKNSKSIAIVINGTIRFCWWVQPSSIIVSERAIKPISADN